MRSIVISAGGQAATPVLGQPQSRTTRALSPRFLGLTADAVVFALVMDALDHDGPVDPSHVVPGNLTVPGNGALTVLTHPQTSAEPQLAAYAVP